MFVHSLFAPVKRLLPGSVSRPLRNVFTALLTPLHFSYATGHFKSSLRARALSRDGRPLPWYSYPAIEFLAGQSYDQRSVLEFGAGQSTLFWAERAKRVVALESDPEWYAQLRSRLPASATLLLVSVDLNDLGRAVAEGERFDLIVVDGLDRQAAGLRAIELLLPGGAIVLDNSECPWSADGRFALVESLWKRGFSRVDFHGYSPGNVSPQCTSIFFKETCFLLRNPAPPMSPFA